MRTALFKWIKTQYSNWPEYVLKDFLYQQARCINDQDHLHEFLHITKQDFGQVTWKLERLQIIIDSFTPKTQSMIKARNGGLSNPHQVPKDLERHAQQLKMIQREGIRVEPIIVAKLDSGYDLIEGWHRTIQHLEVYPTGYIGPAWVGHGATYSI